MRRCVARVNRDNASISAIALKSNHKWSAEVCSVFKMVVFTSAILDLKFWRQNFNILRLRMSPCAYAYHTCKQPYAYACANAYPCFVRINQPLLFVTVAATVIVVNVTET